MKPTINAAKAGIAILLALALAGCMTRLGRSFDESYAQQIKPGATKAEVLGRLGRPPLRSGTPEEEVWTYAYYEGGGLREWLGFGISDEEYQTGLGKQARLVLNFKGDVVRASKFTQEIPMLSNLPSLDGKK